MQIPGTIIRINRMDQAIKLTALAYQCHISASYLSQIETGKAQPDPQILQLLAKALDLDYTIDQAWLIPAKQKLEHFVRNALLLDLEAAQEQAPALRRIRETVSQFASGPRLSSGLFCLCTDDEKPAPDGSAEAPVNQRAGSL